MTESPENPFDAHNPMQRVVEFYDVLTHKSHKKEVPKDLAAALVYNRDGIEKAYAEKELTDSDFEAFETLFKKFEGKSFASYNLVQALIKDIPKKFHPYSVLPQVNPGAPNPAEVKPAMSREEVTAVFAVPEKTESLETILGTASGLMERIGSVDEKLGKATDIYSKTAEKIKADYQRELSAINNEKEKLSGELRDYASKYVDVFSNILRELQKYAGQKPADERPTLKLSGENSESKPTVVPSSVTAPESEQPKKKSTWKRVRDFTTGAVLAALLAAGGAGYLEYNRRPAGTPINQSPLEIKLNVVKDGLIVEPGKPVEGKMLVFYSQHPTDSSVLVELKTLPNIPAPATVNEKRDNKNKREPRKVICYSCDGETVTSKQYDNKCPKGWQLKEPECKKVETVESEVAPPPSQGAEPDNPFATK